MKEDTKAVAREIVAWFTSGNSVPVDVRHVAKVNGDRIMADADRLHRSIHEDDRSTGDVDRLLGWWQYLPTPTQRDERNEDCQPL